MDIVFYDRYGQPFCYTEDGVNLYAFDGTVLAYIDAQSIFSFPGVHLGWFADGWIRDNRGGCVLFCDRAVGGPGRPGRSGLPGKSGKRGLPGKGGKQGKPGRPAFAPSWSAIACEDFFELN